MRSCLPDRCSTSRPEDRYRDDGSGPLRRLQVLHCRLSLQRSIHQLGNKSGGQLRLLPEDQANGEEPACVQACRHGALYFGDVNDPQSIISRLLRVKDTVRIRPHLGTEPSLRYVTVQKEGV